MGYTALYRKFRPATFDEVKGQDHVVTTLKNQIKADRLGHAYLFYGTRGTGKTSVAKIFAKAVNCEHPVDGNPCGVCASCRAIADGSSMNVIEIDAASNNKVDDIRQIREEVAYPPTQGRYKVYIIDEAHMITPQAFNAFLKTLEEPPAYVIFILATTDIHPIPVTILSRCQRYDFHRLSQSTIQDQLTLLTEKEGVKAEERALRYLARKGDGSMRDALSLLDECISYYLGEELTYDRVLDVLGAVDTDVFSDMLRRIINGDLPGTIRELDNLIMQGTDLTQFVNDFTWYMRNLMLIKASDDMEDVLDVSTENLSQLYEESAMIHSDTLRRYIRIFSELANTIRHSSNKRVDVEMAIIQMCKPQMDRDEDALLERIRALEKEVEESKTIPAQTVPMEEATVSLPGKDSARETAPEKDVPVNVQEPVAAAPEDLQEVCKNWGIIIEGINAPFQQVLAAAQPKFNTADKTDRKLYVVFADFLGKAFIADKNKKEELEQQILDKTGKQVEVKFVVPDEGDPLQKDLSSIETDARIQSRVNMKIEFED